MSLYFAVSDKNLTKKDLNDNLRFIKVNLLFNIRHHKSTISRNLNGDIFNLLRLDFINVHTFYKLDPIY